MAETNTRKPPELGYPQIEKLLDSEDFNRLNKSFGEAYHRLEVIQGDVSAGLKKQKAAGRALKAYELTTDLIKELLNIKYHLHKLRRDAAGKQKK